jgi:hypothetical protein
MHTSSFAENQYFLCLVYTCPKNIGLSWNNLVSTYNVKFQRGNFCQTFWYLKLYIRCIVESRSIYSRGAKTRLRRLLSCIITIWETNFNIFYLGRIKLFRVWLY